MTALIMLLLAQPVTMSLATSSFLLLTAVVFALVGGMIGIINTYDRARYQNWDVEQSYYKHYPYILRDFMGKGDCGLVHQEGNMTAPTSGGPVAHVIRGGSDTLAQTKAAVYQTYAEEGQVRIRTAGETGSGVA